METRELWIQALTNTGVVLLSVVLIGLLINLLQQSIGQALANGFGADFANKFMNRLTFIGVVHHELSHALFAFLTGAKIIKMNLFKPDEKTDSLGSVTYAARGPIILRAIQLTFASIAPVICGFISCFLIYKYLLFGAVWRWILFGFIMLCIIIHMNLSPQDIKVALMGSPVVIIIMISIFYVTQFDLIGYTCQEIVSHFS